MDRGKHGSKRHLLVDGDGVPLAVWLPAANVHDSEVFEDVVGRSAFPIGSEMVSPSRR